MEGALQPTLRCLLRVMLSYHMSADMCGKCFKRPSTWLTADNNAAQPALPSHVVLIQAQQAFAAVETIQTKGCLTATQNQDADNLELDSVTGPLKPNTSITMLWVGSPTAVTPALLTANLDSESELNKVPPTIIARKKHKRVQRDSGMQVFIAHMCGKYMAHTAISVY